MLPGRAARDRLRRLAVVEGHLPDDGRAFAQAAADQRANREFLKERGL